MNEKNMLMRKIQAENFAVWELHMFLDTHPDDQKAMSKLKQHEERLAMLVKEYESKYSSLQQKSNDQKWQWINEPWPWEYEGDDR